MEEDSDGIVDPGPVKPLGDPKKVLKKSKLAKFKKKVENTGLVYMSRVPPHMKPNKLRSLLEQHAKIGRIYMAPTQTAPTELYRELKAGKKDYKKRAKEFSEAWIEFSDKKEARVVAEMLNCEPMGGKNRSRYKEDLWNLKFVEDMKWDDLSEEVAYQKSVKEKIFAQELAQAKKERDMYLDEIAKAKKKQAITDRKRQRGLEVPEEPDPSERFAHKQRKTHKPAVVDGGYNSWVLEAQVAAAQNKGNFYEDTPKQRERAVEDGKVQKKKKKKQKHATDGNGAQRHDRSGDKSKPDSSGKPAMISKSVLKMFGS